MHSLNHVLDESIIMCFFSDENEFNLDGPDGWVYYCHDLSVLGAFCFNGTMDIAFLNGRQCTMDYENVFKSNLILFRNILKREKWKLQQNNVFIHIYHLTTDYFTQNLLTVIDWPGHQPRPKCH